MFLTAINYFGKKISFKEFIEKCNSFAEENGLTVRFKYKKKLTYSNLLNQLNNEQD